MPVKTKSDVTEILAKLVSYKTNSTNYKELNDCFDFLEKALKGNGLITKRHSINKHPAIVATTKRTKQPKLILQAHIDVVPAKTGFYKVTQTEGRLYGRGVYDMKFAAACYLALVNELKPRLKKLDFGIMFTCDEEIGGKSVGHLLELGYGADVCFLPDGGNDWQIERTSNALWMIKIKASGEAAHGSRPWEGVNAIDVLIEALNKIHKLFGDCQPNKSSLTLSKIKGGQAVNQVPDYAEATLDMRFIDSDSYVDHRQVVESIVQSKGLMLETVSLVEGSSINLSQPEIASFIEIANYHHSTPIKATHSLGATDARYFAAKGIPTIIIRPTGDGAHSNHEWIDLAELDKFYKVLKAYVIEVASTGQKTKQLDSAAALM